MTLQLIKSGQVVGLGTSKDNIINIVAVRVLEVSEDTIILGDVRFNRSLNNIQSNSNVTLFCFENGKYFQIKGVCEYKSDKGSINQADNLFNQLGLNYKCKGLLEIKFKEFFYS